MLNVNQKQLEKMFDETLHLLEIFGIISSFMMIFVVNEFGILFQIATLSKLPFSIPDMSDIIVLLTLIFGFLAFSLPISYLNKNGYLRYKDFNYKICKIINLFSIISFTFFLMFTFGNLLGFWQFSLKQWRI
jgi:hypothetical protein